MFCFFVSPKQIESEMVCITGSDVNHIKNVLRMRTGDKIRISDGQQNDFYCVIEQLYSDRITARILERAKDSMELPANLWLFQGLPKGDKMDWVVQKAAELGAAGVVPVSMKRCIVQLDEKKAQARTKRWQAIAESAAKQCGRSVIPEVSKVMEFQEALAMASGMDYRLLPYENQEGMVSARETMEQIKQGTSAAIFIGPEGGFEPEEVELARQAGFTLISLGKRILRTETAGLCVLSILMFQLETEAQQKEENGTQS